MRSRQAAPAAVSFYEEHVFHDNAADAQWFHSHLGAIAEATCRGLCEYFGIPYPGAGDGRAVSCADHQ